MDNDCIRVIPNVLFSSRQKGHVDFEKMAIAFSLEIFLIKSSVVEAEVNKLVRSTFFALASPDSRSSKVTLLESILMMINDFVI